MKAKENSLGTTQNKSKIALVILIGTLVLYTFGFFVGKGLYHMLH